MIFVAASDVPSAELALLGNNIRPARRRSSRASADERANRRVLAAVNRSLATLCERVDHLYPVPNAGRTTKKELLA